METFKDIVGYEGLYQVSDQGRVISLRRQIELKTDVFTSGSVSYARVTLSKDSKTERFLVHRLVAMAFLPNPDEKPCVNHKDNNGLNNSSDNLEWCTYSENMQHSVKQGRQALVQSNATQAAVVPNYNRYTDYWRTKLGERFVAFYPAHQVVHGGTKPCAAVRYICSECGISRLSRTNWAEIRVHKGVCPNCTYTVSLTDEDIVSTA